MGARAAAEGFALPPAIAIADASRWYAAPATMPCCSQRKLCSLGGSLDLAGAFPYPALLKGIGIFDTRRVGDIARHCLNCTS